MNDSRHVHTRLGLARRKRTFWQVSIVVGTAMVVVTVAMLLIRHAGTSAQRPVALRSQSDAVDVRGNIRHAVRPLPIQGERDFIGTGCDVFGSRNGAATRKCVGTIDGRTES